MFKGGKKSHFLNCDRGSQYFSSPELINKTSKPYFRLINISSRCYKKKKKKKKVKMWNILNHFKSDIYNLKK